MLSLVALITAQARPFLTFLSHIPYYLLHMVSHLDYLDVDKIEAGVVDARIVSKFIRLLVRPARARAR
jgi:hypothetical protein